MEIDLGMAFLYFTAACFWIVLIWANATAAYKHWQRRKSRSKVFDTLIKDLKEFAESLNKQNAAKKASEQAAVQPEVQTFKWRHRSQMQEVKIVIDPSLSTSIEMERGDFEMLLKKGEAGKMQDLLDGMVPDGVKQKIADQNEFRFSTETVRQLKVVGMTPDELVVKILKAAGRMD